MDAVKFGQCLCALRKERRWTQQEAAARLGVTDKSISKWETARGLPDITVLPALAQLYGVTVDELLAGARRPAPEQNGAAAEPNGQREGPPAGARRAFRLFALACAAEGAAVVLSGMLTALLNAYGAMTPHHEELAARYFGDAALAADWDAWGHAAAAWQEGLQSLSALLLPLALAAVLAYALLRRFPMRNSSGAHAAAPGGGYGAVLCPAAPPLARAGSVPADLAESVSLLVPGPAGDAGAVWNLSCAVSYFQKNQKRNLNRMSVLHPAAIAMKAAAGFFAAE